MNRPRRLTAIVTLAAAGVRVMAAPPLVTGDVPVADPGIVELYAGFRYQDTGAVQRQVPHVEVVYGLAPRWEVSAEGNYLSRAGRTGFDDLVLATKVVLMPEAVAHPLIGASYEMKLANGNALRGLGSGGREHEFKLRAQQTFGRITSLVNFARGFVPDATIGGARASRRDVWRAGFAQEWRVTGATKLLSEIYWRTADEAGAPARLGWNAGFKHRVSGSFSLHAAAGSSLRPDNRGGPMLRVYAGVKWEFRAVPARSVSRDQYGEIER